MCVNVEYLTNYIDLSMLMISVVLMQLAEQCCENDILITIGYMLATANVS